MTNLPLIYAVYDDPADYPGKIVVRGWRGLRPERTAHVFESIDDARGFLSALGLVQLPRQPFDDGCIAETWL